MTPVTPINSDAQTDNWRLYASCIGSDWALFFPKRGESVKAAREICANCIVSKECLGDAIDRKEPAGVRAGLSTRERRKLIRSQQTDTHQTRQRAAI